ncbi:MAG: putative metalloprotease CJM1_0395 family protein, partial [Rhodospirillaceae bacterium]
MAVGSLASVSGMVPAGLSSTLNGGAGAVGLLGQSIAFNRQLSQQRQAQTGTDTTGTAAASTASAASSRQTNSAATSRTAASAAGGTAQSTQTAGTQSAASASTILTAAETAEVAQLKALQQAAQQQAQAQLQAAGAYGGAVSYQYARGPDGVTYVVGASVSFNTGAVPGDPAATIAKMETVRRAALASPQLSAAALQALQSADAAIAD